MSNYHFGDDYDLNYYPPEASDGMGGVDWDKVERVEIECDIYVKERTCRLICHEVELPDGLKEKGVEMRVYECGECGERMFSDYNYCPACGARVVE